MTAVNLELPAMEEDLSQWLREAGQRRAPHESPEELVACLEELTGRPMRTREHIRSYFAERIARQDAATRKAQRRQLFWQAVLLVALLVSFLQYHYVDVQLKIAELPSLVVFVPPG